MESSHPAVAGTFQKQPDISQFLGTMYSASAQALLANGKDMTHSSFKVCESLSVECEGYQTHSRWTWGEFRFMLPYLCVW